MEVNYKSYQKVLNLPIKPKCNSPGNINNQCILPNKIIENSISKEIMCVANNDSNKIIKSKKDSNQIKRRTKTGCLTCRKRKKKCDEDKINGKCQACTRNCLDCTWPDLSLISKNNKTKTMKNQNIIEKFNNTTEFVRELSPKSTKCDINSLLSTTSNEIINKISTPKQYPMEPQPQNAYPSPVQSPKFDSFNLPKQPSSPEISLIKLPPLYKFNNYKLHTTKESNVRGVKYNKSTDDSTVLPSFGSLINQSVTL
ncbi:unnamed protein product [Candida verbasci]|uniref:Zn(2)-C6 fungal-type domain-containing protein n=1 Tax=Candida verbasci TaxID=1227364 RepID=A0A9W4TSN7_9ASCO|nr:unnamed protein product [Candida verbasci]